MDDAPNTNPQSKIVALVRDLIFSSRIRGTAKDLGIEVSIVRDPAQLIAAGGSRLLVDLNQDGAIEAAKQWKQSCGGTVVGFVSHVDAETTIRARAAGIDQVLARSAFVSRLANLLQEASSPGPGRVE